MFSPQQFYAKIFKEQSSLKRYFGPTTLASQNWNADALIGDLQACANTIRLTRYINSRSILQLLKTITHPSLQPINHSLRLRQYIPRPPQPPRHIHTNNDIVIPPQHKPPKTPTSPSQTHTSPIHVPLPISPTPLAHLCADSPYQIDLLFDFVLSEFAF